MKYLTKLSCTGNGSNPPMVKGDLWGFNFGGPWLATKPQKGTGHWEKGKQDDGISSTYLGWSHYLPSPFWSAYKDQGFVCGFFVCVI